MMLDVGQGFARPLIHLRVAGASAGARRTRTRAGRAARAGAGGGPCTCGPPLAVVVLGTLTQQIASLHVTVDHRAHVFAVEIGTAELLQSLHQILVRLIELRWQL